MSTKIPEVNPPRLIPVDEHGWLKYDDNVFLIRTDLNMGNEAHYQYNGTACYQGSVYGFVAASFKSTNKYFNSKFWYKKTTWGMEYPKMIYFDTRRDVHGLMKSLWNIKGRKAWDAIWNKVDIEATSHARPSANILKSILRETEKKTGIKLRFNYISTDYGDCWHEAQIRLAGENGEKYLLTWQNCD